MKTAGIRKSIGNVRFLKCPSLVGLGCLFILLLVSGCTSFDQWIHNGFKVGPNYCKPPAPVVDEWIDAKRPEINVASPDLREWWTVFNDPALNSLIEQATQQNLDVRTAGTRILEARAQRNIAAGNLFPQFQEAFADYARFSTTGNAANVPPGFDRHFDNWAAGFNLAWEIDFWGRFRRAVEAADAELDASVENYDDVLVLLIGEVASTYVEIRTLQERIRFADTNIKQQSAIVKDAETRAKGIKGGPDEIAYNQLRATLKNTESLKEFLEISLRQANNRLCVLLGIPPRDLVPMLGQAPVPVAPPQVAVGIPAELLRRRPDVRRSERQVAAQSARIGIATSNLYPRISLIGSLGYEAENLSDLFTSKSFQGNIGPNARWDILNYGRLVNGIRVQDARFQREVLNYQNTVLRAAREVEDGLIGFIRFQLQTRNLAESVNNATRATDLVNERLKIKRDADYLNWLFTSVNLQTQQQDQLAVAKGNIAQSLILIYKGLGGGWEIRLRQQANVPPDVGFAPALYPFAPIRRSEQLPEPERLPRLGQPRQDAVQPMAGAVNANRRSGSVYHSASISGTGG